ncbi:MAG: RiPP maturation radical SAM C-methyltransferase [Vicinamibacteria bacterium]
MTEPRLIDVALVRMPYSETGQPSLALGLLKAGCDQQGITSQVLSAHLQFAEEIGPALHDLIFASYPGTLIGEWTFAGTLFPDFQPDDEAYLRRVIDIFGMDSSAEWHYLTETFPYLDFRTLFRDVRSRAASFVARTADRVLALEPRIVGCTSTFQQHCASLALLREVKRRRPEIVTMIGGANCEGGMGRATFEQFPFLDFVVSGDADAFFGPMCRKVLESGTDAALAGLPPGVWGPHHRRDRAAVARACAGLEDGAPIVRLEDMNASPVPNFDDYFSELAATSCLGEDMRPALPFQTARGCWWGEKTHCSFCGISRTAMKFRAKSGDNVMEQMIALRDRYGINTFQGTEYIFDYRYFETLLPRLKDLNALFRFEVKANLKPEQLQDFIDAGVIELQPGVESLQDDLLGLLRKGTTAAQNVLLLKRGLTVGISIYWNMLHTIPGDRDEWYREMTELLPLLHHLQPPAGFAQIHYDRFSPYWKDPGKYGLTLLPAFGYQQVYPFPLETLTDMAYFFETPEQRQHFLKYHRVKDAGLLQLTRELRAWKQAFRAQARPRLVSTDLGDRIVFEDTRAVARAARVEIAGLEARVYRATEQGMVPGALVKKMQAEEPSPSEAEIADAIARLLERRLVVALSGRLVGLGVAAPLRRMLVETIDRPMAELNPAYGKRLADRKLDSRRPNIALQCVRPPQRESLTGWLARKGDPASAEGEPGARLSS